MKLGSTRTFLGVTLALVMCLVGVALAGGQAAPTPQGVEMAENVFKNVQVLKGIPVDEFMGTMGVFSAALGMSCENCHAGNDKGWDTYAADVWPTKTVARRMVTMMANINRQNFQGRQVVTCFTCHRGSQKPKFTPSIALLYGTPPEADPSDPFEQAPNQPTAAQVLDKYIAAIGGQQKAAALTSYVAKGTSRGYGPESLDRRPVEIYAKAPGQKSVTIRTNDGPAVTVINGANGWISAPLRPVGLLTLTGQELDGIKFETALPFAVGLKTSLRNLRTGFTLSIDDNEVQPVQGETALGSLITMYFDTKTSLLTRLVRYVDSPVGHVVTQIDYSDYRDVGGVKMPFKWTATWLDGREQWEMDSIQPNVAIEANRFNKPASATPPVSKK